MAIDESTLTKGQLRKLNALRKSIGDKLGNDAFAKWMKEQARAKPAEKVDVVAQLIAEIIKPLEKNASVKLGYYGYVVRRAKGKGAKGFVVEKIVK